MLQNNEWLNYGKTATDDYHPKLVWNGYGY